MAGAPAHLGRPDSSRRLVRSPRGEDRPTPRGVDRLDPLVSSSPRLTLHLHRDSRSCQAKMLQSQKMIPAGIFRRNCQSCAHSGQNIVRVHTRSPASDPEVLGPSAGWPGQLLRPSDNSQEVKNPFDLRITRSLDPVVDQEDLVQQEGRQRHRPVVAQPGMPETFVQLEHLLEPPEERLDRPAASPVQRPPELRLVKPPPLRPVLAAPPPPVRLPPDPLPAAVEERLGFFRVSRSRKRSPGSLGASVRHTGRIPKLCQTSSGIVPRMRLPRTRFCRVPSLITICEAIPPPGISKVAQNPPNPDRLS